jgi:hypothetical protein
MSIYNLSGGNLPGWTNLQTKYGMLGNTSGLYSLTSEMYRGSKFYQSWIWTHGNASEKKLFRNDKLIQGTGFFYSSTEPAPPGSRIVMTAGFLVNSDTQQRLEKEYGFTRGGNDWGWFWSHPVFCVVTADSIPMNNKMILFASNDFNSEGFKSIGSSTILLNKGRSNFGTVRDSFNGDWNWGSYQIVSPPQDIDLIIANCKSSITNANSEPCTNIMKQQCTANDIKSNSGGICSSWCSSNPELCDVIKVRYCQTNPNDTFCDCINSNTRESYIKDMAALKPESRALPKICNTKLCNARTDLVDVFHTSSYLNDKLNYKCPALQIIDQSVNVEGDNNVLDTNQNVNNNTGTPSTPSVLQPDNEKSYTYLYFILLFVLIIVMVLYFDRGNEESENISNYSS